MIRRQRVKLRLKQNSQCAKANSSQMLLLGNQTGIFLNEQCEDLILSWIFYCTTTLGKTRKFEFVRELSNIVYLHNKLLSIVLIPGDNVTIGCFILIKAFKECIFSFYTCLERPAINAHPPFPLRR